MKDIAQKQDLKIAKRTNEAFNLKHKIQIQYSKRQQYNIIRIQPRLAEFKPTSYIQTIQKYDSENSLYKFFSQSKASKQKQNTKDERHTQNKQKDSKIYPGSSALSPSKQLTEVGCDLHLKNNNRKWYKNQRFSVW